MIRVRANVRSGLPLQLRREFKRVYFEGIGLAAADIVRKDVARGRDATGAALPPYTTGPSAGATVTLRRSNLFLDSFRPVRVTEREVVVASAAPYAPYVQGRFAPIGITGETLDVTKRLVQQAMNEVVRKAAVMNGRRRLTARTARRR